MCPSGKGDSRTRKECRRGSSFRSMRRDNVLVVRYRSWFNIPISSPGIDSGTGSRTRETGQCLAFGRGGSFFPSSGFALPSSEKIESPAPARGVCLSPRRRWATRTLLPNRNPAVRESFRPGHRHTQPPVRLGSEKATREARYWRSLRSWLREDDRERVRTLLTHR